MSSTERTLAPSSSHGGDGLQGKHDRSQTQHLEKILLSSSSTSSNIKIQTQSTHTNHPHNLTNQNFIMQSVDNNSLATNSQLNAG